MRVECGGTHRRSGGRARSSVAPTSGARAGPSLGLRVPVTRGFEALRRPASTRPRLHSSGPNPARRVGQAQGCSLGF